VCSLWLSKPCQEWTLQRVGHLRPSRQCLKTTGESFTVKPLIMEAVFQNTGNLTWSTGLGPGSYFSIEHHWSLLIDQRDLLSSMEAGQ